MPDHKEIYEHDGERYDRLVACEDHQNHIISAIEGILSLPGKDVVEFGAGTGRLTCLLAPEVSTIRAFDASQHMLDVAVRKLQASGLANWHVGLGDHRHLPAASASADLAISGWSICYLVDLDQADWKAEVMNGLAEMRRVLRPGGVIILLETMGTGFETPHPPERLLDYYQVLKEQGFASQWIRTDYSFPSAAEALELVSFFFGDELASALSSAGPRSLAECTGIWWQFVG